MTAALGVRVVVIERVSRTQPVPMARRHGPSAFAPLSGTPRLATMRASSVLPIAKRPPSAERRVEAAPPIESLWPVEPRPRQRGKAEGGGDVEGGVALMGGRGMNVLLTRAPR